MFLAIRVFDTVVGYGYLGTYSLTELHFRSLLLSRERLYSLSDPAQEMVYSFTLENGREMNGFIYSSGVLDIKDSVILGSECCFRGIA